ncbi:MAG TPA: cation diffusion facilitator family transporter [Pseudomonadales bacterium]|nr:cation diffusion facilitator family transporter [Pseudomonadales bacterium]
MDQARDSSIAAADRGAYARRVTLIGSAIDASLGVAKIIVGVLANSQALIADGIHSLSDLATDVGVIWVTYASHAEPDSEHPYGHARFETLGTLALGAILMVVAGGIAQDSLLRLLAGEFGVPGGAALIVAAVSVVSKEWIFRYTRRAAERIGSSLLLANAWHSRTDAFSSFAVLAGVAGAMAGWAWLDLAAALVVALMIGWIGWGLIAGAARELVDTGLSAQQLAELRLAALDVPGVVGVHALRSRRMGSDVLLDLDIEVPSSISVSEGHQIAWKVSDALVGRFPAVTDVKVHVDPDQDAAHAQLPMRGRAEHELVQLWQGLLVDPIERITLHYGGEGVEVELFLRGSADADQDRRLVRTLAAAVTDLPWFAGVRIWRSAAQSSTDP